MQAGADPLSAKFAALADPTRRAILARLATGEATVMELAEPFPISQPARPVDLQILADMTGKRLAALFGDLELAADARIDFELFHYSARRREQKRSDGFGVEPCVEHRPGRMIEAALDDDFSYRVLLGHGGSFVRRFAAGYFLIFSLARVRSR